MAFFAKVKARRAYRKAKKLADETGEMLCATLGPGGEPIYFTMPLDATTDDVRDKAFEKVNHRAMSRIEREFLAKAEERERGGYL